MSDEPSAEKDAGIRVWPPAEWCAVLNDEKTHMCDQARGHDGDHSGPELPTVQIDESAWDELEDDQECVTPPEVGPVMSESIVITVPADQQGRLLYLARKRRRDPTD